MWRNVYHLDTNWLWKFNLSILRSTDAQDPTRYTNTGNGKKLISSILGLTNDAGNPLTDYDEIYDRNHEYIILPPYDTCPTCNEPFNNPALGAEYRDSVLYRFSDQSDLWRHYVSLYYFETTGKMKPRD
ncbi:MAG: hypothetical protein JW915_10915 [Chitinispirillaceae bacterium]|nr:hypothetical protein [Chitinispirillaceae bacterium]